MTRTPSCRRFHARNSIIVLRLALTSMVSCAKCGKSVYPMEKITAVGKDWHRWCFKCAGKDAKGNPCTVQLAKGKELGAWGDGSYGNGKLTLEQSTTGNRTARRTMTRCVCCSLRRPDVFPYGAQGRGAEETGKPTATRKKNGVTVSNTRMGSHSVQEFRTAGYGKSTGGLSSRKGRGGTLDK